MKIQLKARQLFWLNIAWFQAVWFIAILYQQQAISLLLFSLLAHFLLTPIRLSDTKNLLFITILGALGDYFLTLSGALNFTESTFIPVWLILLWAHFALALNHSMRWLEQLPLYGRVLFGAIFGTLSYYSGAQLGGVELNQNLLISIFSLSVIWGSLLPVYINIASFNRKPVYEKNKGIHQ